VAECHRHVVGGVSSLEETASKGVTEAVWGRLLFEGANRFKRVSKAAAPDVGDGLKTRGIADNERPRPTQLCTRNQSVANTVGKPGKHMMPVLLRSNHDVIALQSAHVEQRRI